MKDNLLYLAFHSLSMLFTFFTTVLLSRYFSVEEFGIYQLILTFLIILNIFKLTGIDMILQRMILKGEYTYFKYAQKKFYKPLLIIWLVSLIALFIVDFENKQYMLLVCIVFPFILFERSAPILLGLLEFKMNRGLVLLQSFLIFISVLIGIYFEFKLNSFILFYLVVFAIIYSIKIYISSNKIKDLDIESLKNEENRKLDKDVIKTSLVNGYAAIATYIDRLILGFLDPKFLAFLIIAQVIPRMIKDNIKVFLTPTYFKWVNISDENSINKTFHYRWYFILVGFLFYCVIVLGADFFITTFYGENYSETIIMMQVLSIPIIFKFLESSISSSIVLVGEFDFFNKINIVFPTLKILGSFILIFFYGIWGAITTIVAIELIRSVYLFYWIKKYRIDKIREENE